MTFPLRIHVYEDSESTIVACRLPTEVFESSYLMQIGVELDEIFLKILKYAEV